MIHLWHDLPSGLRPPEDVNAVIEIPAKSRNKYELDKRTGLLKLDRVLYSAVHYPGDYGADAAAGARIAAKAHNLIFKDVPTVPGATVQAPLKKVLNA